jgi:hypothetical protein
MILNDSQVNTVWNAEVSNKYEQVVCMGWYVAMAYLKKLSSIYLEKVKKSCVRLASH